MIASGDRKVKSEWESASECVSVWDRETQRERHRKKETERQRETERERETKRERDRERERAIKRERESDKERERETDKRILKVSYKKMKQLSHCTTAPKRYNKLLNYIKLNWIKLS